MLGVLRDQDERGGGAMEGTGKFLAVVRLAKVRHAAAATALHDALSELGSGRFREAKTAKVFTPSGARIIKSEARGNMLAEM
jgi:hypothetical protein